jgi:hypothetical protein
MKSQHSQSNNRKRLGDIGNKHKYISTVDWSEVKA